jgi:hypothetical protein
MTYSSVFEKVLALDFGPIQTFSAWAEKGV